MKATVTLPEKVKHIAAVIESAGGRLYLVGGAVRDWLLGRKIDDWDFTSDLAPEKIQALFPKNSFYNNQYGTVSVVGRNKEIYEITTFRVERHYRDRRHPDEVRWGKNIEEDLSRRDFTINAIAIPLGKKVSTERDYIDLFGGRDDIKAKLIRAVGDPGDRFREDALRMIRAVRIASQIGFAIEEKTYQSIRDNAHLLDEIALERIRDEFFKILLSEWPREGITLLYSLGLLDRFLPELGKSYGVSQAKHHIYDVWNHSLNSLAACKVKDPVVRLAVLIHDIGKPMVAKGEGKERTFHNHEMASAAVARRLAQRFRLSKDQAEKLYRLVRWHQFSCDEKQTDRAIRRFIRQVGLEHLDDMIELRRSDRVGGGARESSWRFDLYKKRLVKVQEQPFSLKDLKIDGNRIMKILKIRPGPIVGKLLNKLFEEVEEDVERNNQEYLDKRVKEIFAEIKK